MKESHTKSLLPCWGGASILSGPWGTRTQRSLLILYLEFTVSCSHRHSVITSSPFWRNVGLVQRQARVNWV